MPGPGDIHPHLDSGRKPSGQGEPQVAPGPLPPTGSSSPHPRVQRSPLVGTCGVRDQSIFHNIETGDSQGDSDRDGDRQKNRDRDGSGLTVDGGEEAEGSHRAEDRATGQRNRESQEAHRTSQVLTVPEWGCLRCHTNHTHGSADTRDKSKSHRSSCTVVLSAHCRVISCGSAPRAHP